MTDWDTGIPDPTRADAAGGPEAPPTCPWCNTSVKPEQTNCPACGAALAQRESIAGLKIPGLTSVDPALEDFDKRPLHLRGPSPSQGVAPGLIIAAAAGGPIGMLAIGGVAAVAAAELMGTKRDGPAGTSFENVGQPSELLLQAIEHADAGGDGQADAPEATAVEAEPDHAADDGGRSVWRDLPPSDDASDSRDEDPR
jgi:hypothetical protein